MNINLKEFNSLIEQNSTKATVFHNGCFYYFQYLPTSVSNPKKNISMDLSPLIYCIGLTSFGINLIEGLNFRHLPIKTILTEMDKCSGILKTDERTIIKKEKLLELDPQIQPAIRNYNLKNVMNCYLIKNSIMPVLIEFDIDHYVMSSTLANTINFNLSRYKYTKRK
jgi:hypothetical protein